MIIHKQDIDPRLHVTVLVGIVEQYDFRVLCFLVLCETVDAMAAVLVYGYVHVGEFLLHLERFVPNHVHFRVLS